MKNGAGILLQIAWMDCRLFQTPLLRLIGSSFDGALAMIHAILVGVVVVSTSPRDVKTEYQARLFTVGRDTESQVMLALWCESKGLESERAKHLATAILTDPGHVIARGLLGLVAVNGKWKRPEAVAEAIKADPVRVAKLAEYRRRREALTPKAEAHARLATWCDANGLADEASAHWRHVVRLDPGRDIAWRRLGFKSVKGRWVTEHQLAQEQASAAAEVSAKREWLPQLKRLRDRLKDSNGLRRADALAELALVTDPRAVTAVWEVFGQVPALQGQAVQLFGQLEGQAASEQLAGLAIFGTTDDVRRKAIETLRLRDGREFLGSLISLIQTPWKYTVQHVTFQQPGEILIEGPDFKVKRAYTFGQPLPMILRRNQIDLANLEARQGQRLMEQFHQNAAVWNIANLPSSNDSRAMAGFLEQQFGQTPELKNFAEHQLQAIQSNANDIVRSYSWNRYYMDFTRQRAATMFQARTGLNFQQRDFAAESGRSAIIAEQQLESDVAFIQAQNQSFTANNERTLFVLDTLTNEKKGEDRDEWMSWWTNQQGYFYSAMSSQEKPTLTQTIPSAYFPRFPLRFSCFAAETPIRTMSGMLPIQSIGIGDKVLVQNTDSGALEFAPVLAVFHNPPVTTLKIELGDEVITATPIHRFWKAGKGWTMARDLKVGDPIRTLEGVHRVASIEPGATQLVFNLEVARGSSFLVGVTAASLSMTTAWSSQQLSRSMP